MEQTLQSLAPVKYLRRSEIERKAGDILRSHGLETVPINPVTLAERVGIRVNNAKFADDTLSGMIAKRGDDIMILVSREDSPNRKRFTIAHELAHHFLHLVGDGEFVDREADLFRESLGNDSEEAPHERRAEIQANIFAASLLMPEESVLALWEKTQSVTTMAAIFGVSEESMGYRLDKLGLL